MLAFCRRFLPAVVPALVIVAPACSSGARPSLEGGVDSTATVVVGDVTYELRVACYESDAELTAVGVGTDGATGKSLKGLVRGPSSSYVGLMFGDDEYIYEPDANVALTIRRDGDRLLGDEIPFVRDVDLDSAEGTAVGIGSVVVECASKRGGTPVSPLPSR
jgi:hypothetical protein